MVGATDLLPPPDEHPEDSLADDVRGHFGLAARAIGERDRNFRCAKANAGRPPGVLDLEAIAIGFGLERTKFQQSWGSKGPESGGGVVHRQPENEPNIHVAGRRDEPSADAPIGNATALDVTRPDCHIRGRQRVNQLRHLRRWMRQIGVHLHDDVVVMALRPRKTRAIGGAESILLRTREQKEPELVAGM